MANLHKVIDSWEPVDLAIGQFFIALGQMPKFRKLIVVDIGVVFFRKQIFEDPNFPALGQYDAAVLVLVQTLLEYAAARIIRLPDHRLRNRQTKLFIPNARLASGLGETSGLEHPHSPKVRPSHRR